MDIAFSMPDGPARRLRERWGDLSRRALEAVVAQAYREGTFTLGEVRRLLGHATRLETEAFLKKQGALLDYTEEELDRGLTAARNFDSPSQIDLRARGIDEAGAEKLRVRLLPFAEDWESPEMSVYDDYDAARKEL